MPRHARAQVGVHDQTAGVRDGVDHWWVQRLPVGVELAGGGAFEPGHEALDETAHAVAWVPLHRLGCVETQMSAPLHVRGSSPPPMGHPH